MSDANLRDGLKRVAAKTNPLFDLSRQRADYFLRWLGQGKTLTGKWLTEAIALINANNTP